MSNLIIVNDDNSVSLVVLADGTDMTDEATKLGGVIYDGEVFPSFNKWENGVVVKDVEAEKSHLLANLRTERNRLLTETDWTANSDVTMSEEMATYRQALRDLPETVDIYNPVFPDKP
jgi:ribosomal protein L35